MWWLRTLRPKLIQELLEACRSIKVRRLFLFMADRYHDQVCLLLDVLPLVTEENILALKRGTAINLFERDLPRLSVDIDLTYLLFDDRETALREISAGLARQRP